MSDELPQDWEVYITEIEEKPASFFLNLGLVEVAPLSDFPSLVTLMIHLRDVDEHEMPSDAEVKVLNQIEDYLDANFSEKNQGIYVGRITLKKIRTFYFYIQPDSEWVYDKIIAEIMLYFPDYEYDYDCQSDIEWKTYFEFLFPDSYQIECILNQRVLQTMEAQGDNLSQARQVDHWIYFQNEIDREKYIFEIEKENFKVEATDYQSDYDFSFQLHISRFDKIDYNSVDEYVWFLKELAIQYNGKYDGWETSIIK